MSTEAYVFVDEKEPEVRPELVVRARDKEGFVEVAVQLEPSGDLELRPKNAIVNAEDAYLRSVDAVLDAVKTLLCWEEPEVLERAEREAVTIEREAKKIRELLLPEDAEGGQEFLRLFLKPDGGGLICVHAPFVLCRDDPAAWGIVLADVARHASRSMAGKITCAGRAMSEDEVFSRIVEFFQNEVEDPSDKPRTLVRLQ